MSSAGAANIAAVSKRPFRLPLWTPVLVLVVGILGYVYYDYIQAQEQALNRNYFRELANISLRFEKKLEQFNILINWDNPSLALSGSNTLFQKISGLFPSVRKDQSCPAVTANKTRIIELSDKLRLSDNQIFLQPQSQWDGTHRCFRVDIGDFIGLNREEFSSLLLVNRQNQVVATTQFSQALSVVNVEEFSKQIAVELNRDWLQLIDSSGRVKEQNLSEQVSLPGFSHYVDIKLNPGAYRLFFYPLTINNQVLNLVGVLPADKLSTKKSQRWTWGVWLISFLMLVAGWVLLRLFLLSIHQTVDEFFYRLTLYSAYLLFSALVALGLAFAQMQLEKSDKATRAFDLLQLTRHKMHDELTQVFAELERVSAFYQALIAGGKLTLYSDAVKVAEDTPEERKAALQQLAMRHLYPAKTPSATDPSAASVGSANPPPTQTTPATVAETSSAASAMAPLVLRLCDSDYRQDQARSHKEMADNAGNRMRRYIWTVFAPHLQPAQANSSEPDCLAQYPELRVTDGKFNPSILQVSLLDAGGRQIGPRISHVERQGTAKYSELAMRDYYKQVRQGKGWDASAYDGGHNRQFYIQRLRNIEDGTFGATLGLSLPADGRFFEVVADILLPSLEFFAGANALNRQDFVLMVVDRGSGEVLFHDDPQHVLSERLDASDADADALRFSLRARRDSKAVGERQDIRAIAATYHGERGWFVHIETPIAPWSLVAFIPADALDNYMTNMFWVNWLLLSFSVALLYTVIWAMRKVADTGKVKSALHIPLIIDRRKLVLFTSVLAAALLAGYWSGRAVEYAALFTRHGTWIWPLGFGAAAMLWGAWEYRRLVRSSRHSQKQSRYLQPRMGLGILTGGFALASLLLIYYLNQVGDAPDKALTWYYAELHKARRDNDNALLQDKLNQFFASSLVYQSEQQLRSPGCDTDTTRRSRDVRSFAHFTQLTQMHEWWARYMMGCAWGLCGAPPPRGNQDSALLQCDILAQVAPSWLLDEADTGYMSMRRSASPYANIALTSAGLALLLFVWVGFNRSVLYVRLFGSLGFLRHLNHLQKMVRLSKYHHPDPRLCIVLRSVYQLGDNLASLLQQAKTDTAMGSLGDEQRQDRPVRRLLALCADVFESKPVCLAGVRIKVTECGQQFCVGLFDLDGALEFAPSREQLLMLLTRLTFLVQQGTVSELNLCCDFHSLSRINTTENLPGSHRDNRLSHQEYLSWAECLKDFTVKTINDADREWNSAFWRECLQGREWAPANKGQRQMDARFIGNELAAMPMLSFLRKDKVIAQCLATAQQGDQDRRWTSLSDEQKSAREWAACHHLLLHADALYRYWWSLCSPAEKLALYYLASGKRVNPGNVVVLEQLATNGLIIVRHGRIRIANQSFAYFVRHAETVECLRELISHGNLGQWQQYKVPITLLAVILLVALGIFSGNSLYVMISSVLGLLGLVGNLLGSVNFIRTNVGQ